MGQLRLFRAGWVIGLLSVACSQSSSNGSGAASSGGSENGGAEGGGASGSGVAGTATAGSTTSGAGGVEIGGSSGGGSTSLPDAGIDFGGVAGSNPSMAGNGGEGSSLPDAGSLPSDLPAGYTLQFQETFATATALDRMVFANPTDWSYATASGGYLQSTGFSYAPQYYSPHSIAVIKGQRFASFVLEVELLQTSMTGPHRDYAIFWGMQGPNQYYYAHIGQVHDDAASHNIQIVDNADRKAITETHTDGFDWGDGVWHKFRLVRDIVSGAMQLYGDDAPDPILTATDTTLGEGYIGFGSFDDTGGVRNVKIWALTSTAETADFFQSAPTP